MSVHFSPSFRTSAPLAGPGEYRSRSVIFFSLSFFWLMFFDPGDRGGVREQSGERTRTAGTEPASHPPLEVVPASVGKDGAVHPPWIPQSRPRVARADAWIQSSAACTVGARSPPPAALNRR